MKVSDEVEHFRRYVSFLVSLMRYWCSFMVLTEVHIFAQLSREREKARKKWAVDHGLPLGWYLRTYRSEAQKLRGKRGLLLDDAAESQHQDEPSRKRPTRSSSRPGNAPTSSDDESSDDDDDFQSEGIVPTDLPFPTFSPRSMHSTYMFSSLMCVFIISCSTLVGKEAL